MKPFWQSAQYNASAVDGISSLKRHYFVSSYSFSFNLFSVVALFFTLASYYRIPTSNKQFHLSFADYYILTSIYSSYLQAATSTAILPILSKLSQFLYTVYDCIVFSVRAIYWTQFIWFAETALLCIICLIFSVYVSLYAISGFITFLDVRGNQTPTYTNCKYRAFKDISISQTPFYHYWK